MDLFATMFGVTLTLLAVVVTYVCGIKPERDEKKRRAEQIRAEQRRRHFERIRRQAAVRSESITDHS